MFIADIDRTYLSTRFSSLRGMARIPFEGAAQKRDIEGMARLIREIRRGPGERSRDTPLYFVSASPKQLRPVIERKMGLDGISFDGTTFKDWGRVLRRAKFRRLKEQVGFKMTALMTGRAATPEGAHEILLGDDLETDPVTYAIYADALAGRIPIRDLIRVLRLNGVGEGDAEDIMRMRRDLRPGRARAAGVDPARAAHRHRTTTSSSSGRASSGAPGRFRWRRRCGSWAASRWPAWGGSRSSSWAAAWVRSRSPSGSRISPGGR